MRYKGDFGSDGCGCDESGEDAGWVKVDDASAPGIERSGRAWLAETPDKVGYLSRFLQARSWIPPPAPLSRLRDIFSGIRCFGPVISP